MTMTSERRRDAAILGRFNSQATASMRLNTPPNCLGPLLVVSPVGLGECWTIRFNEFWTMSVFPDDLLICLFFLFDDVNGSQCLIMSI